MKETTSCSFFTPCCFLPQAWTSPLLYLQEESNHASVFTCREMASAALVCLWKHPHCLTAWSHLAGRLFMGAIPASESFFSSVLSWSVCVCVFLRLWLMLKPTHTDVFFFLLADHKHWHCSHQNPACLFQNDLISVTLVTVFDMRLLLPHTESLNIQYLLF